MRTCDGYYFPISYSTVPSRFADDDRACQRLCPASEVALYSYRNPGEDIEQAVSTTGQPYTALPNAFRYRKEFTPTCRCRKAGQSWADALKNADDSTTLESGDIVVTDQNAKALSQAAEAIRQGGCQRRGGKSAGAEGRRNLGRSRRIQRSRPYGWSGRRSSPPRKCTRNRRRKRRRSNRLAGLR